MSAPAAGNTFRVLVADDHPVVRIGVRNILASVPALDRGRVQRR